MEISLFLKITLLTCLGTEDKLHVKCQQCDGNDHQQNLEFLISH
jgi:hypothetical protein